MFICKNCVCVCVCVCADVYMNVLTLLYIYSCKSNKFKQSAINNK